MHKIIFHFLISLFILNVANAKEEKVFLHHSLEVSFDVSSSKVFVADTISFPVSVNDINFYMNPNLIIENLERIDKLQHKTYGNTNYNISINGNEIVLKYEGVIDHNIDEFKDGGQGKYKGTNGLIFDKGIYLSGTTYWVPTFEGFDMFTFDLSVNLPQDWKLISQGDVIKSVNNQFKYSSMHPSIQVYLIANKWTEYKRNIAGKDIRVYLINPDEALAQRYLGVTSKYMMMYQHLLGDYPYSKFDVVENFWETGFGMPSFTLLGQQVIRFPWILASSYPHEYLHNYLANSVFVDYDSGNWSEGLTTYLADYLLQEQKGEGANYRRNMLKKYSDYVKAENDYPIREFRTKTDEASDAIGYGKAFMFNHMLRTKFGTRKFVDSYSDFYAANKFKKASFSDIQNSFEKITGDDLSNYFDQWVNRKGAPSIFLNDVDLKKKRKQYVLTINLSQSDDVFDVEVPVFVYLKNKKEVVKRIVNLNQKNHEFQLTFDDEPVRIDIDPEYDVMRWLDKNEVPATLSQTLGAKSWTIVLPTASEDYEAYKTMAKSWQQMYTRRGKKIDVVDDNLFDEIPVGDDKAVWILGDQNKSKSIVDIDKIYDNLLGQDLESDIEKLNEDGVLIYAVLNPGFSTTSFAYLDVSDAADLMKLSRKLMHYGSKSYLGFESGTLKNSLQGVFPVLNSPLSKTINTKENFDWSDFTFPETDPLFQKQ